MAVSRALRRLLRIRDLEEEQHRLALEAALGELHRLEKALAATDARARRGRGLVHASAGADECTDRQASLVEIGAARRHATVLTSRRSAAALEAARLRVEFLEKRVERRQAETLIQESEAREVMEAGRHGQQALDDWYGSRLYREQSEMDSHESRSIAPHLAHTVDKV